MALFPNQRLVVNQCNRSAIRAEFVRVANNWKKERWLKVGNRYAKDTISTLKAEAKAGKPLNHPHLRQYIAASSATHCMDGWAYLGKAIEAHLKGDGDISRHLGYYSELRATMALLAAEGIGVFDKKHYIVDSKKKCNEVPKPPNSSNTPRQGTHIFTWEAVEFWASQSIAADLIFDIIQPGGRPLAEWFSNYGILGGSQTIIAKEWLAQWGLDLSRLADDREARNIASYRPTAFTTTQGFTASSAIELAKEFWSAYEPQLSTRFHELDKYLLKSSLEFYFQTTHGHGRTHKQAKRQYEKQIKSMLHTMAPSGLSPDRWKDFLLSSNKNALIEEAKGTLGPDNAKHHVQVIARASLLLRLATGACQKLFANVEGATKDDTRFWWADIGENHSLWHNGVDPVQFIDLWTDIKEAIDALEKWETATPVGDKSYYKLTTEVSEAVGKLGTCERIGLWGFGL